MNMLKRMVEEKRIGVPVYNLADGSVSPDGYIIAWSLPLYY